MASSLKSFSIDKAMDLNNQLKSGVNDIERTLKTTQGKVEAVTDWWKGGSEQGFIENFRNTKNDVEKSLQQWLESYQTLMKEVVKAKQAVEQDLKNKLSKA